MTKLVIKKTWNKMGQPSNKIEEITKISIRNCEILETILNKLKQIIKGKRGLMYSDIINLIVREGYIGENYNQLILWCNYKIRLGKTFVDFEWKFKCFDKVEL